MPWIALTLVVLAVLIAAAVFYLKWSERDGEWHADSPGIMRRFVSGRWEMREMTNSELEESISSEAW
jgi:uncharacterized protein YpmS